MVGRDQAAGEGQEPALAKQAAVHTVAMLKGEVVAQFTADQFGSTASSVLSVAARWHRPASSALSSMHEPPHQPAASSHLGCLRRPRRGCSLRRSAAHSNPSSTSTARLVQARPHRGTARLHEHVPPRTCLTWPTCSAKCQCSPWATRYCLGLLLRSISAV
jgi:hypothetical protein